MSTRPGPMNDDRASEQDTAAAHVAADAPSFFLPALQVMLVALVVAFAGARALGLLYHPKPLTPDPQRVAASDRFVLIFGNSRFDAGIDAELLARALSGPGKVDAEMFVGGGWDAVHFYGMAILASEVLRPGRDAVVIDVSPYSLDDTGVGNKLGVIRPEAAVAVASVPGTPLENRLDVLLGGGAYLYRYRQSVQGVLLGRVGRLGDAIAARLARVGLVGAVRAEPPYTFVTQPGREWVMKEILGDKELLRRQNRRRALAGAATLRVGGFKLHALERAIDLLRAKNIEVFLVEAPFSDWLEPYVAESAGGRSFSALLPAVANAHGAHFVAGWAPALHANDLFYDDSHMVSFATPAFTNALADRVRASLPRSY